jgi:hypothetical protein
MKRLTLSFVILISLMSSVSTSHASLIPCATAANPQICSLCDILVLGNNLTNWAAGILLPLGILAFGISGVLYLIQKPDQAKSLMAAAAKGIIISLSAFLIVNVTLRALDVVQPTGWNTFTCTAQVAQNPSPTDKTTFNTTGDGGPKDTVGNPGDITGDPTVTPTTPICNENRDTSSIPMTLPLSLTLNCTNPDQIASAIWRFPSDSNFGSQTVDNKIGITFTSIDNPSNWTEVTVVVTDTKGRTQTYTYGFIGLNVAGEEPSPVETTCPADVPVPSRAVTVDDPYTNWFSTGHPGTKPYVVAIDVPVTARSLPEPWGVINFAPKVGPGGREYTVSRYPCDFTKPVRSYGHDRVDLNYDPSRTLWPHTYYLTPGRWYLNLRSVAGVCGETQTCSMNMQAVP